MAEELKPSYSFSNDRLDELVKLFPEAFEDGKINVDTLKEIIGVHSTDGSDKEHFGLNWVGKIDARRIAAKAPTGTLKPCIGEGINEEASQNILIEGENLEVLKILRKSYAGKVRMIYIDPPYNTGNDFIYKDDFSDSTEDYLRKSGEKSDEGLLVSNPKSSGKYHANWLSFIYPRLRIAKDLLTEDGIIFISIGPDEVTKLSLLCDEIFGEENRASLCVRQAKSGGNIGKFFSPNVEFILVYAKNAIQASPFRGEMDEELIRKVYTQVETVGTRKGEKYRSMGLYQASLKDLRPNQKYFIECPDGSMVLPPCGIQDEIMRAGDGRWRWTKPKFLEEKEKGNVEFKESREGILVDSNGKKSKWNIYTKIWLNDRQEEGQIPNDLILKFENRHSSKELQVLDIPFDFAKPSELIKYLIDLVGLTDGDLVMDFFAGSGTTAHAVLKYNLDRKTNANFILIQLPEKVLDQNALNQGYNVISDITKARIAKSIALLKTEYSNEIQSIEKIGYRLYKQDRSNVFKWRDFDPNGQGGIFEFNTQLELALKNPLVDGVNPRNLTIEILLQEGFPLTSNQELLKGDIVRVSSNEVPYTLYICWSNKLDSEIIKSIELNETDHFICLDKSFGTNNSLKQTLDNRCKLFTI